jgi:hypothetical protein
MPSAENVDGQGTRSNQALAQRGGSMTSPLSEKPFPVAKHEAGTLISTSMSGGIPPARMHGAARE